MSAKIDARLMRALDQWNARKVRGARELTGTSPVDRIVVIVTYSGSLELLRAAGLETGFSTGRIVSGLVAPDDIRSLAALDSVEKIELEPPLRLGLDNTIKEMRVPWKVPPAAPWPGKGANVIVAVIDTGIDIFHDSFRKPDGSTRILELWDQGVTVPSSPPPAGLTQIGAVFNSAQIGAALAAGPPFASRDTDGHGTHVAGTAAGNGRQDDRCYFPGTFVGVAPEADLVIVRAIAIAPAQSSANDAFAWCATAGARHQIAGRPRPVVTNCSFGSLLGPHDGTGTMDLALDAILRPAAGPPAGLAFVILAGNSGEDEQHDTGTIAANSSATIAFHSPDRNSKMDGLDIWYNGNASLNITITAPLAAGAAAPVSVGPIAPGAAGNQVMLGTVALNVTSSAAPQPANNNRRNIFVAFSVPGGGTLPAGTWQFTLTETSGTVANWQAWFSYEHDGNGRLTFRPLDDTSHTQRRRINTLWEPGTCRNVITVASYDDRSGDLAESSSRGVAPALGTPEGEIKPTVAAPGVGVKAPRSRDDPDDPSSCCDQRHIDKSGTSMASPHVAGLVALMFEKNRDLTFEQARAHLQKAARIDGIPAADVPVPFGNPLLGIKHSPLWGSGKVNAAQTLADIPAGPTSSIAGGGGGGGPTTITLDESQWGYAPHNFISRLGDWKSRFGEGPGLMLAASLISEHVDEVLRLVNRNRKVGAVWRRHGGPKLVRHLLDGIAPETPLPIHVQGCDVPLLLSKLLPMLDRHGGARIRSDIARYGPFALAWPGAPPGLLDAAFIEVHRP